MTIRDTYDSRKTVDITLTELYQQGHLVELELQGHLCSVVVGHRGPCMPILHCILISLRVEYLYLSNSKYVTKEERAISYLLNFTIENSRMEN